MSNNRKSKRPSLKSKRRPERIPEVSEVVEGDGVALAALAKVEEEVPRTEPVKKRKKRRQKVEDAEVKVEKVEGKRRKDGEKKRKKRKRKEDAPKVEEKVVVEDAQKVEEKAEEKAETETLPLPVLESKEDVDFTVPPPSTSRRLTKAQLELQFDEVLASIEQEIECTRENKKRDVSIKTWRNMIKEVRRLKRQSLRHMKKHQQNSACGFKKPVQISDEMASFLGIEPGTLISRNNVTKQLCAYIRDNNLQNPEYKRFITPDAKLTKLLRFNKKDGPLTYYGLQVYMKPHFV